MFRFLLFSFLISSLIACSSRQVSNQSPQDDQARSGAPELSKKIATQSVKAPASFTIYFAEIFASEDAEFELAQFRTGEHNDIPSIYGENTEGLKELVAGSYYQELSEFLIAQMADWYDGTIPENQGIFMQSDAFRPFGPSDAFWEMLDGIDMADIIGSITHKVRMSTKDGYIHFMAVNDMSLESYAGENYLRHGLVDNPESGRFRSTTQVFLWKLPIPKRFRNLESEECFGCSR